MDYTEAAHALDSTSVGRWPASHTVSASVDRMPVSHNGFSGVDRLHSLALTLPAGNNH